MGIVQAHLNIKKISHLAHKAPLHNLTSSSIPREIRLALLLEHNRSL